jgi:dihydrolipoamide dehydrogenase
MAPLLFDVIIIGAGPGGYVCAIRAAQLGLKVLVVDKRERFGGTCLNVGCIPSKALLHASHIFWQTKHTLADFGIQADNVRLDLKTLMQQKETTVDELTRGIGFLFKKNNIQTVTGEATITSPTSIRVDGAQTQHFEAKAIVIATGSQAATLKGISIDEHNVLSSTGALSLPKVPRHLVVVGGGYIGLEMASVWGRLGSAITVVEFGERILPHMDRDLSAGLHKVLEKKGFQFRLSHKVMDITPLEDELTVSVSPLTEGQTTIERINGDAVLVAVGRRPYTDHLGLEQAGITLDARGFITVNSRFQTGVPSIYAIGDVIGGAMLAHKASHEGIAVAEILAGQSGHVNYGVIPSVIYTHPEAASVGQTEQELQKAGVAYNVGTFNFAANSRAKTLRDTAGFVKILADKATDKVLGVHILGAHAGAMIAEAAMAMEFGASSEDIARTCHAHPTHSEALMEAAWATFAKALHA